MLYQKHFKGGFFTFIRVRRRETLLKSLIV